ncbi:hypothetical protein EDB80DRAFT_679774 [Ilyonectria destructans]|nr:hypothetical protein EDB80DRAFT_679774 [Ilyonectria destructans]
MENVPSETPIAARDRPLLTIEQLPGDVLFDIATNIGDLSTFQSLISSSPTIRRAFKEHEHLVATRLIQRYIHPSLLPEAVVCHEVNLLGKDYGSEQYKSQWHTLLEHLATDRTASHFKFDLRAIYQLVKFHKAIELLTQRLWGCALSAWRSGSWPAKAMTRSEQLRTCRAMYRLQIFFLGPLDADIAKNFSKVFCAWEVDQMIAVQYWLTRTVAKAFKYCASTDIVFALENPAYWLPNREREHLMLTKVLQKGDATMRDLFSLDLLRKIEAIKGPIPQQHDNWTLDDFTLRSTAIRLLSKPLYDLREELSLVIQGGDEGLLRMIERQPVHDDLSSSKVWRAAYHHGLDFRKWSHQVKGLCILCDKDRLDQLGFPDGEIPSIDSAFVNLEDWREESEHASSMTAKQTLYDSGHRGFFDFNKFRGNWSAPILEDVGGLLRFHFDSTCPLCKPGIEDDDVSFL